MLILVYVWTELKTTTLVYKVNKLYIVAIKHNNSILVYKSQQDAQVRVYFVWQLLYMFQASLSPIFRSTKQL
jgi:hypothetical protein